MIDPNKPIIDVRTTGAGIQPTAAAPASSGGGTTPPPAQPDTAPISPTGSSSSSSATVKTSATNPIATSIPEQYTVNNYDDIISLLEKRKAEYKPLSEEELKKLRRRQKVEGIISGISDASQALSNLIFTTRYAPNMYNAKEGMTAKAKERFDKAKAERQARDEIYYNYAMNIARLKEADRNHGLQIWQLKHGLEREAKEDELREATEIRTQAKADRDAAMADLRMKLLQGKITEQEAVAQSAQIEADYKEAYLQSRINKNNRLPSRGGGRRSGGSGSGSKGGSTWYATDEQGNVHTIKANNGVHANNVAGGKGWNLINPTTISTTTTDITGTKRTTTSTKMTKKPKSGKKNRLGL